MTKEEFIQIENALSNAFDILCDNNNLNLNQLGSNALSSGLVSRSVLRLAEAIETLKALPECQEFVEQYKSDKVF